MIAEKYAVIKFIYLNFKQNFITQLKNKMNPSFVVVVMVVDLHFWDPEV